MSKATAQATEIADVKQKLELADEDITHINIRLNKAQGMFWDRPLTHV